MGVEPEDANQNITPVDPPAGSPPADNVNDTTPVDPPAGEGEKKAAAPTPKPKPADKTPAPATEPAAADYKAPDTLEANDQALLGDDERVNVLKFAKEHKMSQEQAQGLYDLMEKTVDNYIGKGQEHLADLSVQQQNELKRDKELGGLNYAKTQELVQKAFNITDKKGELQNVLKENNLTNNRAVVKFLKQVGESLGGENVYGGTTPTPPGNKAATEQSPIDFWNNVKGAADVGEGSVFS